MSRMTMAVVTGYVGTGAVGPRTFKKRQSRKCNSVGDVQGLKRELGKPSAWRIQMEISI